SGYLMMAGTAAYRIGETANLCHPERHRATEERGKVEGSRASFLSHAASGSSHETSLGLSRRLQNGWKILRSALREIFDESAYERFLQRTRSAHSAESYRAFMRERESAAARKPRCC
ncbi:MAG TPA: CstA-like transporter-associated (seleno)protein, partial [Candidatus Angelobacter sp.]|nr:CstA-like transporter-associated (seleno)protein [Candidatus Angelobacter sp.]